MHSSFFKIEILPEAYTLTYDAIRTSEGNIPIIRKLPADLGIGGVPMSQHNGRKLIGISDAYGNEMTIRNVEDLESDGAKAILKKTPRFVRSTKMIAKICSGLSSLFLWNNLIIYIF